MKIGGAGARPDLQRTAFEPLPAMSCHGNSVRCLSRGLAASVWLNVECSQCWNLDYFLLCCTLQVLSLLHRYHQYMCVCSALSKHNPHLQLHFAVFRDLGIIFGTWLFFCSQYEHYRQRGRPEPWATFPSVQTGAEQHHVIHQRAEDKKLIDQSDRRMLWVRLRIFLKAFHCCFIVIFNHRHHHLIVYTQWLTSNMTSLPQPLVRCGFSCFGTVKM